jgi:hypothetical protein
MKRRRLLPLLSPNPHAIAGEADRQSPPPNRWWIASLRLLENSHDGRSPTEAWRLPGCLSHGGGARRPGRRPRTLWWWLAFATTRGVAAGDGPAAELRSRRQSFFGPKGLRSEFCSGLRRDGWLSVATAMWQRGSLQLVKWQRSGRVLLAAMSADGRTWVWHFERWPWIFNGDGHRSRVDDKVTGSLFWWWPLAPFVEVGGRMGHAHYATLLPLRDLVRFRWYARCLFRRHQVMLVVARSKVVWQRHAVWEVNDFQFLLQ